MKSLTIGTKFRAGFLALFAATLLLGITAMLAIRSMNQSFDGAVRKAALKLELGGRIDTLQADLFSIQRGIVLATFLRDRERAASQKREFAETAAKLKTILDETAPLVSVPEGKRLFPIMSADLEKWLAGYQELLRLCESGNAAKAQEYSFEKIAPIQHELADSAGKFVDVYHGVLVTNAADAADEYSRSLWISSALLGLAVLIGVGILLLIGQINGALRQMLAELASGAQQVAAASGQIATSSQSLSQGASEQASSVEEISASMEEMTAMTRSSGSNSSEAMSMMIETAKQVERSNAALSEMVASMSSIKSSSERVAKINKTIDEIAFQTNILALNAAVEAARAGEAGKGFAVVADEVRNLAQRAAAGAKDTAALIEESIANSNQGAQKLELVSSAIVGITEGAQKVKQLVTEVNEAGKQQVQGIQQVSTAIQQVSTVTQTNASSAEESAAAAEELNAQSLTVRELVNKLRQMVGTGQKRRGPERRCSQSRRRSERRALWRRTQRSSRDRQENRKRAFQRCVSHGNRRIRKLPRLLTNKMPIGEI